MDSEAGEKCLDKHVIFITPQNVATSDFTNNVGGVGINGVVMNFSASEVDDSGAILKSFDFSLTPNSKFSASVPSAVYSINIASPTIQKFNLNTTECDSTGLCPITKVTYLPSSN
jgi:hypothetical protein